MNESHETTASKLKYQNNQWVASQGDENWLVVLNPEVLNKLPIPAQNHLPDTTDKIFPQEGVEYDWPGTIERVQVPTLQNKGICRMIDYMYKLFLPETTASGDTAVATKKSLKDYLHLYLGCRLKIGDGIWADNAPHTFAAHLRSIELGDGLPIKLILRPLSDMDRSEAKLLLLQDDFYADHQVNIIDLNENVFIGIIYEIQYNDRGRYWKKQQSLTRNLGPNHIKFLLSKGFDLFNLIEEGD